MDINRIIWENIREINNTKELFTLEAIKKPCAAKDCNCGIRTARWVLESPLAKPYVERFIVMCDAGHTNGYKFILDWDQSRCIYKYSFKPEEDIGG